MSGRSEARPDDHPDVLRLQALLALGLRRVGDVDTADDLAADIADRIGRSVGNTDHWIVKLASTAW